jgi:hypothetical protein
MMDANIESGFCITIDNLSGMNQTEGLPFILEFLKRLICDLSVFGSSVGHLCKTFAKNTFMNLHECFF